MNRYLTILLLFLFGFIFGLIPREVCAENWSSRLEAKERLSPREETKAETDADAKERYLPGEEVQGRDGRKVRVWSTRGPVPVNTSAPTLHKPEDAAVKGVDVLVTPRRRPKHPHHQSGSLED